MRTFSSYGPVIEKAHFCVKRPLLIQRCVDQLLGAPEEGGGHFFTIWAPRQTGKTWLVRQAKAKIERDYPGQFIVAEMSMQGVVMEKNDHADLFLRRVPQLFQEAFRLARGPQPSDWERLKDMFRKDSGLFGKPVILMIDEFDKLPQGVIDALIGLFRDIYLKRGDHVLHSLALIGVRAVLGVDSPRGSPFNVQRSLDVPRFDRDEVVELFRQYQDESGQKIEPEVVEEVWTSTRGQPGLVCWFGELLTEKYNPDPARKTPIGMKAWQSVHINALFVEPNNTIMNMVAKARGEHLPRVLEMFSKSDIPFAIDAEWCNYLFLNGLISFDTALDGRGGEIRVCRFTSPFIQKRIYNALCDDMVGDRMPILALEPLDRLDDVFEGGRIDCPALLKRYTAFLARLKAKGLNPWRDHPRRADLGLRESVGHFHLYAWAQQALKGTDMAVTPEFPTGNGKVDLHLHRGAVRAAIEVKSHISGAALDKSKQQAADYAVQLGIAEITLVVFVPTSDPAVIAALSGTSSHGQTTVHTVAIAWE
ncbi:MAG: hypothetical protein A3K19_09725 [Lentisphaerae bacterium RIFOXYB12_FULL_65_16]|nr:MAG: hypothetical protein A3K18_17245 [Lentisphaerae bacterium RIFOXYA12_64_32]OGV84074.1 MAG: hypothetical protein A3K19_09725 [Lentisphaerae bacterium RIFOXYB12_FULL_65_16]